MAGEIPQAPKIENVQTNKSKMPDVKGAISRQAERLSNWLGRNKQKNQENPDAVLEVIASGNVDADAQIKSVGKESTLSPLPSGPLGYIENANVSGQKVADDEFLEYLQDKSLRRTRQAFSPSTSESQVKEDLINPRAISKKYDPQGRSEMASTIVQTRKEAGVIPGQIDAKTASVAESDASYASLYKLSGQKSFEAVERQKSLLVRLKAKLGIGDKKLQQTQAERDSLYLQSREASNQSGDTSQEIEALKKQQDELPNPKDLLAAYYEKMQTVPLTQQEKREFLKPEILESLTTEEYIALWKRLNPHFLSHVTRQGFRDHNAMIYHSGGMQEFHGGFTGILGDEMKIRPPLAINGLANRDEESVRKYLDGWVLQGKDEEEAKTRFQTSLTFSLAAAPNYADKTAVHFMAQTVGDNYYGGETGNEVFFVFPSDTVASQYDYGFNGWQKDLTKMQSEDKWNDVFVWPNEINDPGIPVNAGLAFLPESTPVDPITGSKYASRMEIVEGKEKRVMIEDTDKVGAFVGWVTQQNEQSPIQQAANAYSNERNYQAREDLRRGFMATVYTEIQKLGFTEDAAIALASRYVADFSSPALSHNTDEGARDIIERSGAQWKRAENPVPAKHYWDSYFAANPNQQPKHIVYYDGDPHTAVYEFQQKNGIGAADTSETEGKLLGFDDHFVANMSEDPRANKGYAELVATGNKIIEDKFGGQRAA